MVTVGKLPYTPNAELVFTGAVLASKRLGHSYQGTEHLLLGLVDVECGIAAKVLRSLGVTPEDVQADIRLLRGQNSDQKSKDEACGEKAMADHQKWSPAQRHAKLVAEGSRPVIKVEAGSIVSDFSPEPCITVGNQSVEKAPQWMTLKEAREVVAVAWCAKSTSGMVFNPELAEAFASIMMKEVNTRLAKHELSMAVEKISPQAGDVVIVTMPEGSVCQEQVVAEIAGLGLPCQFIVAPHGYQVASLDEASMKAFGWVRQEHVWSGENIIKASWSGAVRDIKADLEVAKQAALNNTGYDFGMSTEEVMAQVLKLQEEIIAAREVKPYVGLNEVEATPQKPVEVKKNPFFSSDDDWR
jgi:hypothetical protein